MKKLILLLGLVSICLTVGVKPAMAELNKLFLSDQTDELLEKLLAPSVIYVSPQISKVNDPLNVRMKICGSFEGQSIRELFNSIEKDSNNFVILKVIMLPQSSFNNSERLLFIYTDKTNFQK